MRAIDKLLVGFALACASLGAQAQVLQGGLELRWGDPSAAARASIAPAFSATLVLDSGARIALDPDEARRAAGDLYALANRRVAITVKDVIHAKHIGNKQAVKLSTFQ